MDERLDAMDKEGGLVVEVVLQFVKTITLIFILL